MPPYNPPPEDLDTGLAPRQKPLVINTKVKSSPSKNPLLRFSLGKKSPRGLIKSLAGMTGSNENSASKQGQAVVGSSPRTVIRSDKQPKRTASCRQSRSRSRGGRHQIFAGCTGGQRSRSCTPERNAKLSCTLPVQIPPDLLNLNVGSPPSGYQPDVTRYSKYPAQTTSDLDMNISHKFKDSYNNNNLTAFDRQIQQMLQLQTMGLPMDDITNRKPPKPHLRPEVPMGTKVQRSGSMKMDSSTYSKRPAEVITMGTKVQKAEKQKGDPVYNFKSEYKKINTRSDIKCQDSVYTVNNVRCQDSVYTVGDVRCQDSIYSTAAAIPNDGFEENPDKDTGFGVFFRRFSFKRKSAGARLKRGESTDVKKVDDTLKAKNKRNEYTDVHSPQKDKDVRRRSKSADRRSARSSKQGEDYYNEDEMRLDPPEIPAVNRRHSTYSTVHGMKGRPLPPLPPEAQSTASTTDTMTSRSTVVYAETSAHPPQSGVSLVKTIHLDQQVKNKWISGLAVTKKGEYVIVDQAHAYLVDEEGNLKRVIGSKGHNKLNEPIDVTVMCNGNLAFSDHADQDVKLFNCKGQFLRRVKDQALTNIAGVASNNRGEIIIAGTDKKRLSVHSENDELLYTLPSDKHSKVSFEHPYTVAVNPLTQVIIVGDDYRQLVTALSSDGQRIMWRFSPSGGRDRHFFPSSICVDNDGYIFIADLYNEKVYMLDSSGKYLKTLLSRGDGLKAGPGAIATDGQGHLLVADEERTIKVFKYGENGFALYRRISYGPGALLN